MVVLKDEINRLREANKQLKEEREQLMSRRAIPNGNGNSEQTLVKMLEV